MSGRRLLRHADAGESAKQAVQRSGIIRVCTVLTADVDCSYTGKSLPVTIEVDPSSHLFPEPTLQKRTRSAKDY